MAEITFGVLIDTASGVVQLEDFAGKGVSAFDRVETAAERLETSTGKVGKQFGKLASASEYAAAGLKKVGNIIQGMAFGAVIGAVSAVTEELISYYKESVNTKEKAEKLKTAVVEQTNAWKLVPNAMNGITQATVNAYNAQIKYLQLLQKDNGETIKKQIDGLEQMRRISEINMKAQPGRSEYFKREVANFNVQIAAARVELEKWKTVMDLTPTTVDKVVKSITAGSTAIKSSTDWFGEGGLTSLIQNSLSLAMPALSQKIELTGNILGKKFAAAVKTGAKRSLDLSTLDFSMKLMPNFTFDNDAAWREDFAKRVEEEKLGAGRKLAELEKISPYNKPEGQLAEAYSMAPGGSKYEAELQSLQDFNTQKLQLMVDAGTTQFELEQEHERLTTQMKNAEYKLRLSSAAGFAGGMSNFFQNLYTATGSKNKAMFEAAKAFAVAEAVINTALAATKALSAPPGPPWSLVYVAAAIAAGAAQIATIRSAQPGGGASVGASGGSSPSVSGGSFNALPAATGSGGTQKPEPAPPKFEIHIYNPMGNEDWDALAEEQIIPAINRARRRSIT